MKQLLLLLLIISSSLFAVSQTVGNEWINFNQKYYSFDVYLTGLHRIDQAVLSASGIPTESFTSQNMQIFGREKEIPLHVVDGGDNSFDPGDYVLFYAEKNDGWLDSLVYRDPEFIANPSYSLYNDTIHYFFSWNSSTDNLRFTPHTDTDFTGYTPAPFVNIEVESQGGIYYSEAYKIDKASGSVFASGEGWGIVQNYATTQNSLDVVPIPTPNVYSGPGAPAPEIHISTVTNSFALSSPNHHLKMDIGPSEFLLIDTTFWDYRHMKFTRTLPQSAITSGTTALNFRIIGDIATTTDRQTLNYYRLRYSRLTHSGGQLTDEFNVPFNVSAPKSLIDLAGHAGSDPVILSLNGTPYIHSVISTGSNQQFLVPNIPGGQQNRIIVSDLSAAFSVDTLRPAGTNGAFTNFSAVSMEKAYLMITHPKLAAASAEYATYRAGMDGGNLNVITANVNELYDQYGGGIPKHICGVRRFALHSYLLAAEKPVGMFLAGKSLHENGGTRQDPSQYSLSLIPTFGYPGSDIAITSGLSGTLWEPLIPTGRIAATTNEELLTYLEKVKQYEEAQATDTELDNEWQKKVLHFVGGSDAQQQTDFRRYMDSMAVIISDSVFAGNVISYYKTSSDPLDPSVVSGVTETIENGVSLMNFFSHAAVSNNGFEINIDDPANWNNTGKYPVVLGNSCLNGNIHINNNSSISEHFVKLPNEGAIAFISTITVGYDYFLAEYSNRLYNEFSKFSYGLSIGEQMKQAIRAYQATSVASNETFYESTASQMTLHGDPMLRLNWHAAPEISIKSEDVYFTPTNLNLGVDTITAHIILTNLGRSVVDTFNLTIRRNFPMSATDSLWTLRLPKLNYKDTIEFRFPMQPGIGLGENQFTIQVDLPTDIQEEHDEFTNNEVKKTLFIRADGILPVWPYDFAVVPIDSVTVRASTIDPISPSVRTYLFELDTVHFYNSPELRKFSVTASGGVKEVNPGQWKNASGNPFPLVCQDSTVYFWRVALDSSVLVWTEYSFQYIEGKEGWGQDHFFQFKKNDFYGIDYDQANRRRNFPPSVAHQFKLDVYNYESLYTAWFMDGNLGEYGILLGGDNGVYVVVIDPITLEPWKTRYLSENPGHFYQNENDNPLGLEGIGHPNRASSYFAFRQTSQAQMEGFIDMIENEIPAGHYVAIYTSPKTRDSIWSADYPQIYTTFQNIGASIVQPGQSNEPFALFYKNGDPSSLVEMSYPTAEDGIHMLNTISQSEYIGLEKTPFIGPSTEWKTVFWKRDSLELFPSDSVRLRIEAYDINKALQVTIDTLFSPDDSLMSLNSLLPAAVYPWIRLGIYNTDLQFFTPAQIDRLHVLFQPVPEAAIDGTDPYFVSASLSEGLFEGQTVSFAVDVRNISAWPMDSLLINYWIEDQSHVKHYLTYARQDSLVAGETFRDTLEFSTMGYPGFNSLWMEVNPYVNGSALITDQPEQFHFNNLLQLPFTVEPDDRHPILDVTFNGSHILNDDIINPKSEILITLKDDNPLRVMDNISDTTLFGIYITDPQGNQKRIPFMDGLGNTVMQWIPANAQNMKFKIIWPSEFTQDGKYTLFVQGTDRSGNLSGDMEYRIRFEVIRESSITFMMNYPNPFSTSTRFVFTLTGSETPDDMIIQIMTVTGRVVREITEAEIGRIGIGRNISEYAWDGTDEFGDPLANGVYLYRVKAKINGEDIKHRESAADSHFKKEFGKMYLMR